MVVRIVSTTTLLIVLVLTGVLILSDVSRLRFLGLFFVLFWIDFLWHIKDGDRSLKTLPNEGTVNVALYSRPPVIETIIHVFGKQRIHPEHFGLVALEEILKKPLFTKILLRLEVDQREFQGKLRSLIQDHVSSGKNDASFEEFQSPELLEKIITFAKKREVEYIELPDLFAALITARDPYLERLRRSFALNETNIALAITLESNYPYHSRFNRKNSPSKEQSRTMNKAWTAQATPQLDAVSEDMTAKVFYEEGFRLFGHEAEYQALLRGLTKQNNPNVLLVGEAGSGRGAVVHHLAFEMATGKAPAPLNDMRLLSLDVGKLLGVRPEEMRGRLEAVIAEVLKSQNIVLFIPEIELLFRAVGADGLSLADTLLPVLNNDGFPVLGTTTPTDFARTLEMSGPFLKVFERVDVEEIKEEAVLGYLVQEALAIEAQTKKVIAVTALRSAYTMAKSHLRPKLLPGSALQLLGAAVNTTQERGEVLVRSEEVYAATEGLTKIPVQTPQKEEREELLDLEKIIHRKFVDQEEAVKSVADALREYRSGLQKESGPIASFLFVGPTGVGKTALAKVLAELQFGNQENMIRFDMSEYQDKQSVFQLIGSPDGSIVGSLTEAVRNHPYSLLLFDEFEKAFPDIHHLFLQILDEGRLTDTLGRTVSFEEAIIIATSNAHSEIIEAALRSGKAVVDIADDFRHKLTDVFKPELINRFSKIIVFKNLSPKELREIAALHIKEFSKLLKKKNLELEIPREVLEALASWGYDPAFGARPLDRAIEEKLRAPLAKYLLQNQPENGSIIRVSLEGKDLIFSSDSHFLQT